MATAGGAFAGQRADALATVTPALTRAASAPPSAAQLRTALYQHAFNPARAATTDAATTRVLAWAEQTSLPVARLADPQVPPGARRPDGAAGWQHAAANTITRKRAVFHGALGYAVETGLLVSNPADLISCQPPKAATAIHPDVVASPAQAEALLAAVGRIRPDLTAFFGWCISMNRGNAPQFHLTLWLHLRASCYSAILIKMVSWPRDWRSPAPVETPLAREQATSHPPKPAIQPSTRTPTGSSPGTATQSSRTLAATSSLVPDAVPGLFSCGVLRRAKAGVGAAACSRRAWPGGSRGATRSGGPLVPNFAEVGNAEPLPITGRVQDVLGVPSA